MRRRTPVLSMLSRLALKLPEKHQSRPRKRLSHLVQGHNGQVGTTMLTREALAQWVLIIFASQLFVNMIVLALMGWKFYLEIQNKRVVKELLQMIKIYAQLT